MGFIFTDSPLKIVFKNILTTGKLPEGTSDPLFILMMYMYNNDGHKFKI